MNNYDEYLEFAKSIALKAGDLIIENFNNPKINVKENSEIVTQTDKLINQMVINEVANKYPNHSVYGEEKSTDEITENLWSCDPIDGTNLFSRQIPMCVFSLAFVEDGTPKVGVVFDPFQKKLYSAIKGQGSYMNDKKISIANDYQKNKVMNVDWWDKGELTAIKAAQILCEEKDIYFLSPGSTTHSAMLVATGMFVGSIFPGTKNKSVDIAAAKVIVEEAGGKVTDFDGNEQRYDQDINGAIISNSEMHEHILDAIKRSK